MAEQALTDAGARQTARRTKRYPGTIERRGGSLRVILYAGGKRHAFTLATLDRREAVDFAKAKAAELENQARRWKRRGLGPVRTSVLFDRFEAERLVLKAPNTQTTYRSSLAGFRAYFVKQLGDPLVHEVESDMVAEFLAWRRGERGHGLVSEDNRAKVKVRPVSNRTLAKERTTLHAVFAFAEELRLRDGNPVEHVERPKADPRTPVLLTDSQFEKLLREMAAVSPMHELYALLLGETGGRCESEALWLRWEDVDLEQGFMTIVSGRDGNRTKSGRTRFVPLTARLQKALAAHQLRYRGARYPRPDGTEAPSPWVFYHLTTRRRGVAGERVVSLYGAFKSAANRAGLPPDLHQHDLRHRRVTTWIAEGKDVVLVKEAVGHADLRTTMAYTHLAKEHLRALVDPNPGGKNLGRSARERAQDPATEQEDANGPTRASAGA